MKWLITVKQGSSITELADKLSSCGGHCDPDTAPIPLGDEEEVIEVDGPEDLPQRLADEPDVLHVHPNSEMDFHTS